MANPNYTLAEIAAAVWANSSRTITDTRLDDIHKVHGLDASSPLVVDDVNNTRIAGPLIQSVNTIGSATTVQRH
jgi:hypothetical protein